MKTENSTAENSGSRPCYPPRRDIHPSILVGLIGSGNYMMPNVMPPMMDCERCQYMRLKGEEEAAAGLHCYMFRDKPDGDRCGQMTIDG